MQKFTFVPNQRLNFLCGENGSGKSAVLTAIVFALGGTARTANRGTSNKGFIRTNQNSATVDITLANTGENQYRPGKLGTVFVKLPYRSIRTGTLHKLLCSS
jgi:chromosome segregation ATPase